MNKKRRRKAKQADERTVSKAGLFVAALLLGASAFLYLTKERAEPERVAVQPRPKKPAGARSQSRAEYAIYRAPDFAKSHSFNNETVLVWGGDHQYTEGLRQNPLSNIRATDYAGEESCRKCHPENHDLWSNHAHRWMNVLADGESVKGDFSGGDSARIEYLSGTGDFYQDSGNYMMRLSRDGVVREFKVNRTLGSRIHQYYIGTLQKGPEPKDHPLRSTDHVLPFGFELTMQEWIPLMHATGHDGPDSNRDDPFKQPSRLPYDQSCSVCHTTPPMGNLMLAMFKRLAAYTPRKLHFEGSNYVDEMYPGQVQLNLAPGERMSNDMKRHVNDLTKQAEQLLHQDNAVDLGIACEACHLGAKAHALDERIKPLFYPSGSHVFASGKSPAEVWGRNDANKNFICARCHSGSRPQFAAGMAVWNSTEYTDAMRGHCYQPKAAAAHGMNALTCVSCHNPHETIGRRWQKTAAEDQASCIRCHTEYEDATTLQRHTHHAAGEGSQCMNCHMPKINEGMGDLVRTHTIFSPTNVKMLEANQPNACNMCHVEESIDWTLKYLNEWYGLVGLTGADAAVSADSSGISYSKAKIASRYPNRSQSVAVGWLSSKHSSTRLVGADVLLKAKSKTALPQLLLVLDDPYMEIRQFTVQRLRDCFDVDPDQFGYKLYMTKEERQKPIQRMLNELTGSQGKTK